MRKETFRERCSFPFNIINLNLYWLHLCDGRGCFRIPSSCTHWHTPILSSMEMTYPLALSSTMTWNPWVHLSFLYKPYVYCFSISRPSTFFLQVKHVFKSWETGKCDRSGAESVRCSSSDNYGDCTVKETQGTGPFAKDVVKTDPRASQFLKTTKDLTEKHWAKIFAAATEFLNTRHKQKQSQSASSHASLDFIEETMPEFMWFRLNTDLNYISFHLSPRSETSIKPIKFMLPKLNTSTEVLLKGSGLSLKVVWELWLGRWHQQIQKSIHCHVMTTILTLTTF